MEEVTEEVVTISPEDLAPVQAWCLFHEGYEKPFSGNLHEMKEVGTYHCGACDNELFKSEHKLVDEGGRPSFWYCIKDGKKEAVVLEEFTPEQWKKYKSTIDNTKIIPIHLREPHTVPKKIKCADVSPSFIP